MKKKAVPVASRWRRLKPWGLGLAAILAAVYLSLALYIRSIQERLLFPAYGPDFTECTDILKLGYTPKRILHNGELVRLLWWPGKDARGTVMLLHGNGGTICYRTFHAEQLRDPRWNVALIEYPGYGLGAGQAGQEAILRNAVAAFDAVKELSGGKPVVVFGKSLGSGPATYVGQQRDPAGLILHTPYPSLNAVAGGVFHHLIPVWLINRHPMPAEDWAPDVRCPVLALHGDADTLIPISLGKREAQHFHHIDFITIPGADHNTLAWKDHAIYWDNIKEFCATRLK